MEPLLLGNVGSGPAPSGNVEVKKFLSGALASPGACVQSRHQSLTPSISAGGAHDENLPFLSGVWEKSELLIEV